MGALAFLYSFHGLGHGARRGFGSKKNPVPC